jgi:hypothetical protein
MWLPNGNTLSNRGWAFLVAVAIAAAGQMACGRLLRQAGDSLRAVHRPVTSRLAAPFGGSATSRQARTVIRQAVETYGGERAWADNQGLEMEATWKIYNVGGGVDERPALLQIVPGFQPQTRIHFSALDQVFGLGDQGPWVLLRDKPDRDPAFLQQAHFAAATMGFFLSIPHNLLSRGVVVQGVETTAWGGEVFDAVRIGFRGQSYPWPNDTMTIWFQRPSRRIDRCHFQSTAPNSGHGAPPNYLWVFWREHELIGSLPLARNWSFNRSDAEGALKEKLFDVEVKTAAANRAFMPVLFREPVIEPVIQRLPTVGRPRSTTASPTRRP